MAIELETYKISLQGTTFIVDTSDDTHCFETINGLIDFIKNDLGNETIKDLIKFEQIGLHD